MKYKIEQKALVFREYFLRAIVSQVLHAAHVLTSGMRTGVSLAYSVHYSAFVDKPGTTRFINKIGIVLEYRLSLFRQ